MRRLPISVRLGGEYPESKELGESTRFTHVALVDPLRRLEGLPWQVAFPYSGVACCSSYGLICRLHSSTPISFKVMNWGYDKVKRFDSWPKVFKLFKRFYFHVHELVLHPCTTYWLLSLLLIMHLPPMLSTLCANPYLFPPPTGIDDHVLLLRG